MNRAPTTVIDVPSVGPAPEQFGGQKSLLGILVRRRWTVLTVVFLTLGGAFLYLLKATPIYASSSRIYIEQGGTRILSDEALVRRSDNFIYTQAEVLKSAPILNAAVKQVQSPDFRSFAAVDNPVGYLQKGDNLEVSVGKKDDILSVTGRSPHPEEAAQIVNAVVTSYVNHVVERKKNTAAEMLKVLQRERAEREAELDGRLREVAQFKQSNGSISFTNRDRGNIVLERLATLSSTLTTVELDILEARTRRDLIRSIIGDPELISAFVQAEAAEKSGGDRDYQALQTEIRNYQMARANRSVTAGAEAKASKLIEKGLETLQEELKAKELSMAKALLTQAEVSLTSLEARAKEVRASVEQQQKEAFALNSTTAELARLEANVERTQKQCDLLDARIKEINVNSADAGTLDVQVLEVARPEARPASPRKTATMAAALMLGLLLGCGLAFGQDLLDQRIRTPEEVADVLGISVLGIIPHIKGAAAAPVIGRYAHEQGTSEVAEAFRTVRTALFFGAKAAKTIMITSPTPGDGKSTTASNVAIAMAQAGHRTLLIDCDLRRPTQHKIHGLDPNVGLTQVIEGHVKLKAVIARTMIPRLHVLPCGPLPSNPAEMLSSRRFEQVLAAVSDAYDRIVLDSPPLNAVADARMLASLADATVLVLRVDRSTRRGAQLAIEALNATGASIAGAVVNDVPKTRSNYGYYYNGYYGADSARALPSLPARDDDGETRVGSSPASDSVDGEVLAPLPDEVLRVKAKGK